MFVWNIVLPTHNDNKASGDSCPYESFCAGITLRVGGKEGKMHSWDDDNGIVIMDLGFRIMDHGR